MARIRGVILDVDGTLVDSNHAHAQAWVDALTEAGYQVEYEKVRAGIGMGGDKLLPSVIGVEKDSDEGKRLSKRRTEIFQKHYLPHLQAFPQTRELLQRIRERAIRLAVASSAEEKELKALLKIAGADDLIAMKASSEEVEHTKPDPDIVESAYGLLGNSSDEVVMIGDTPYDVQAATRAGVRAIAFRCGGWDDEALAGASAIYDGPADLLAHLDESIIAARP
ncbi:MAG TPA: HAD family hydrolase [Chloroflexia bacterium]|nr:HAD family hydrolase [Chloroflexia bacterium]